VLDADAVRRFCSGRIAHYKIPRYVHLVDNFPMTANGKVRKVDLRVHAARSLGLGLADVKRLDN
jgi:fatty-acyl-CoA synthase